ncbi:MAG TPA: DedA family protein [Aggregatilineales bacterium]|nr:DedA family protein [Chloroflexota bacterium]HQA67229.1 DedA family protein [Aggregatilineales bacterium]
MAEILEFIRVVVESVILTLGYPGIALVMFIENIFPPIPSEVVIPFAGFLVERGEFSMVGVLASATVGVLIGAVVIYYIGVWADEPVVRGFVRRYGKWFFLSEEDIDRAMAFFDRYGEWVVFFGRLIPIIRSLISLPAGMNRMRLPRFLLFTALGSLIWNTVLGVAGYFLGANWERILDITDRYEKVWLVLMALAVIGFFGKRIYDARKKAAKKSMAPAEEIE